MQQAIFSTNGKPSHITWQAEMATYQTTNCILAHTRKRIGCFTGPEHNEHFGCFSLDNTLNVHCQAIVAFLLSKSSFSLGTVGPSIGGYRQGTWTNPTGVPHRTSTVWRARSGNGSRSFACTTQVSCSKMGSLHQDTLYRQGAKARSNPAHPPG
eukprot:394654-Amphidinium_carterae.1